jgi:AP-1 complex subunit mu
MRAELGLPSVKDAEAIASKQKRPITVNFTLPYFTSGIKCDILRSLS